MSTEQRTLAILGMSSAGKTTYIARLWLSVYERLGRLHAAGLPQAFKPLRHLSAYLLRGEYPHRTNYNSDPPSIDVPLRWSGRRSDLPFILSFTDYAGEELERILAMRDAGWTYTWKARATKSVGLLLFLRPDNIVVPRSPRLASAEDFDTMAFQLLRGDALPDGASQPLPAENPALIFDRSYQPEDEVEHRAHPSEPVHPPTAVALVETLQFLRHERGLIFGDVPAPDEFRIAVIVSRWDEVARTREQREEGPQAFVQRRFALLHDFICANFDATGVRFFGLSATGGDLWDKTYRERYAGLEPAKVGEVVYHPTPGGSVRSDPDITLPIGWLLEGENVFLSPDAS